jgi:hypothetical protein
MNPSRIHLTGRFLTTFIAALLLDPAAHANFELTGLGGVNYASPTQRTNGLDIHTTGNASATFGLLAAIQLFDSGFDFETGILSLGQQTERDDIIPNVITKMQFVQIPFLIRYNLDESIGLGFGFYTAFAQGNVQSTQNNFTTEIPYEALFLNKTDTGLILNIRARFAIAPPLYVALDARYQHGLTNLAQNPIDLYNTRSIQVMGGLTYQFDTSGGDSENHLE